MTDNVTALTIGALSAVSAAATQTIAVETSSVPITPIIGLTVPIVSALIGAITGYAVLKTTVKALERDMTQLRNDVSHVYELLRTTSDRIARIEGRLES